MLIVNGAQHGLAVTLMALLKPGDVIAADALTYSGFKVLAEALHLEVVPIPVSDQGPDLAALDKLCRSRSVRAVYSMPTLHNPLGWVMPLTQREHLVAIARQHDLTIIEDAAYAFLVEDPPPSVDRPGAGAHGVRLGPVEEHRHRPARRFHCGPAKRRRTRTHDPGDHLEHPGRHDGHRLRLARRRHRDRAGGTRSATTHRRGKHWRPRC